MAAILMIVTSAGAMPNGDRTGLWLEEFAVPYRVLSQAGHTITVASPKGGATPVDPRSDEADRHPEWHDAGQRLRDTVPLRELHAADFAAVFVPGGHGPMFDLPGDADVARLLADFHAQGKPIAAVCHGPAAFVGVTRADGRPLVEGYTLTAFSNAEEKLVGLDDVVPFLLATRLGELGATVENGLPMLSHTRCDRQLVTGQNPNSSEKTAELLLDAMTRASRGSSHRAEADRAGMAAPHPETDAMSDILSTLKREHDELRDLFAELNGTRDDERDQREDLLERVEALLIPHAKWEETVFYPAFVERASHEQKLLYAEAIQEHRAVELAVLPDLHAASVTSRQFTGSAKVLSELIQHHAKEEETKMFAAVRQLFSAQELADLDQQYADWKDSAQASGVALYAKAKTAATSMLRSPSSPG